MTRMLTHETCPRCKSDNVVDRGDASDRATVSVTSFACWWCDRMIMLPAAVGEACRERTAADQRGYQYLVDGMDPDDVDEQSNPTPWGKLKVVHPWRRRLLFFPFALPASLVAMAAIAAVKWLAWRAHGAVQWVLSRCKDADDVIDGLLDWTSGFSGSKRKGAK